MTNEYIDGLIDFSSISEMNYDAISAMMDK